MSKAKNKSATIKCPMCGKASAPMSAEPGTRSPYPFCSDRCKLRDLGKWLDGAYQVPTDDDDLDETIVTTDEG